MALPEWLEPMAATLTDDRFAGPEWVFERKLDGIRLLAFKRGTTVRLLVAQPPAAHRRLPGVAQAIAALPVDDAIFDGEATGAWGRQGERRLPRLRRAVVRRPQTSPPSRSRPGARCWQGVPFAPPVARVKRLRGDKPWERACRAGWEGVIAKRRDSPYEHRRSQALAEDEVRGLAGAGRRRLHRSAGRPRRPRRAAGRLLRRIGPRLCRQDRHRLRHRAAAHAAGPPRSAAPSRRRPSPRAPACRDCGSTG